VLRTRVGYAGGEKESPTYRSMGNHTEVISIDFDPEVLSYEKILKLFWGAHRCDQSNRSRQYMNALFYHNAVQKKKAEESVSALAQERGISLSDVQTQILPVGDFTYAEAYHQKYYLTRYRELRDFLNEIYPDGKSLADSTVATRLNAYLGSGMTKDWPAFLDELSSYGLPEKLSKELREAVENR